MYCSATRQALPRRPALDRALDPSAATERADAAYVNSQLETGIRTPLETAILQQRIDAPGYQKIDEIPFDFERRRLSVVVEDPDGGTNRLLITKGAPESMLALSTAFDTGGHVRLFGSTRELEKGRASGAEDCGPGRAYRG